MDAIQECRKQVFTKLWNHYYSLVPYAPNIEAGIRGRGDSWIEDHVAYRTLPGPHTGKHILEQAFGLLGYKKEDPYHFQEKKLDAFWMSPPDIQGHSQEASPKIFISELIPDDFSRPFQQALEDISSEVKVSPMTRLQELHQKLLKGETDLAEDFVEGMVALLTSGPSWSRPCLSTYELLKQESEYAAWTYVFGHQINHFTVSVHLMNSFGNISDLGQYLEQDLGIPMNHAGGLVKGTADIKLEQIATMAVKIPFPFQEGVESVSYGFVEFAKRYPLADCKDDGMWSSYYQGFVEANADKIFESTYK